LKKGEGKSLRWQKGKAKKRPGPNQKKKKKGEAILYFKENSKSLENRGGEKTGKGQILPPALKVFAEKDSPFEREKGG